MRAQIIRLRHAEPGRIILSALLFLTLGALFLLPSLSVPAARVQSALLQFVRTQPDAQVAVIVQKTDNGVDLAPLLARLGGRVTQDLSIIHAFAAQLPARAIPELAAAPGVRWISPDAPVAKSSCKSCDPQNLSSNSYTQAINANQLWQGSPSLQGQGITVAVIDSGIDNHTDLDNGLSNNSRVIARVRVKGNTQGWFDHYGHGTHIAGVIGGNGETSNGLYQGVAPQVNLVSVQVTDDEGMGMTSDVVAGMQWVLNNKDRYNIRVVNLSLNSSVAQSYNVDPLDAAAEILWFNKIVVVVSAGNTGPNGVLYAPANDPFVITVGAVNDHGTPDIGDDTLAGYSAYATTPDGVAKPDLVAPGQNIVSLLGSEGTTIARAHRDHVVNSAYFRMSGTSVSAAVVSGAAALLIQSNPALNPDQVKSRLLSTARPFGSGTGAGYLDIAAAVRATTLDTANTGTPASRLLWTGPNPPLWDSVSWTSVSWTSVSWTSVSWTSVSWTSVSWTSDYWGN
ncbi:MAG: S8 family peptidase [Anaerolineae bacterium]